MISRIGMKLALIAALLFAAGTASAASVGINFVDNGGQGVQNGAGDALAATDVAGAPGFQRANWNNLGRWGVTVPVVSSIGAASGITASWDSNNTWNTGSGTSTPDHKLMHGYLDATGQANWETVPYQFFWNENKPQVYLTGMSAWLAGQGATLYDVVVYIDGDTTGRIGEYWLQGTGNAADPPDTLGSDLTSHVFVQDAGTYSGVYTQVPLSANSVATAGGGNFVVFPGLSADRFILRTEERDVRAQISAIQLMPVMAELHDGDTDGDGDVDLDDFAAIRDHFRMSVASRALGDLNEDGFVDFLDFGEWRDNYPFNPGSGANASVPEPSSLMLAMAGVLVVCGGRRRGSPIADPRKIAFLNRSGGE